jgi:hypothetical protein
MKKAIISLAVVLAMFALMTVSAMEQTAKVDLINEAGTPGEASVSFNDTAESELHIPKDFFSGTQAAKDLIQAIANAPAYQALLTQAENSGWTAGQFTVALAQDKVALAQGLSVQPALAAAQRSAWKSETQLSTPVTVYDINGVPYTVTSPSELAYLGY